MSGYKIQELGKYSLGERREMHVTDSLGNSNRDVYLCSSYLDLVEVGVSSFAKSCSVYEHPDIYKDQSLFPDC